MRDYFKKKSDALMGKRRQCEERKRFASQIL
jgi:hypothetical protein